MDDPAHAQGFEHQALEAMVRQVQRIVHEIPGVQLATDPECIHRMRVATRRLRTRLQLFEDFLPEKKARSWVKGLRRLTRALGQARDADVQLMFLRRYLETLERKGEQAGIKRLMVRITQQRATLQSQVLKAVDKVSRSGILDEMQTILQTAMGAPIRKESHIPGPLPEVRACKAIEERLHAMMGLSQVVRDPAHGEELHRMRIAAKHLRYALEAFDELSEGQFKKPIKAAKAIQEMLGDIHDCDVWMAMLPDFLAQEKARTREYYGQDRSLWRLLPGLNGLEQDRREFRNQRHRAFLAYWDRHAGVWKKMMDMPCTMSPDTAMHAQDRDLHAKKRVGT